MSRMTHVDLKTSNVHSRIEEDINLVEMNERMQVAGGDTVRSEGVSEKG